MTLESIGRRGVLHVLQRPPSRARCHGARMRPMPDRGLTAAEIARQTNHADVAEAIAKP
jgi:hypothetical protein